MVVSNKQEKQGSTFWMMCSGILFVVIICLIIMFPNGNDCEASIFRVFGSRTNTTLPQEQARNNKPATTSPQQQARNNKPATIRRRYLC